MSTSVSGSSTVNGLYSNANSISGLVSGLDTESMIENLVDSYNMKIIGYQQDIVMQQWKQEAYRDVTNDLLALSAKYTDLTNTSTNLSSNTYWNNVTTTVAEGENASAVSVSGKTDSSVTVDSVLQVATAERVVSTALSSGDGNSLDTIEGGAMSLGAGDETTSSLVTGSLGLTYGSTKVTLSFTSDDEWNLDDNATEDDIGQAMADLINSKLSDASLGGDPANQKMMAVYEDGELSFVDLQGAGNSIWVSSASTSLKSAFGIDTSSYKYDEDASTISFSGVTASDVVETKSNTEVVQGASMTFNYNGNSVKITLPDADDDVWSTASSVEEAIFTSIESQLKDAFGDSVTVSQDGTTGALTFTMGDAGSNTLTISSDINEILGLGSGTATSYISSSDALGDVLDITFTAPSYTVAEEDMKEGIDITELGTEFDFAGTDAGFIQGVGSMTYNSVTQQYTDSEGDSVVKVTGGGEDGEDIWVKLNEDNELRVGEKISINGEVVGVFDAESSISDVVAAINNSDAGVTASFSTLTNNFVLTANDTGSSSKVEIDNTKLGAALLGSTYVDDGDGNQVLNTDQHTTTDGLDCIMLATVNGEQVTLVRASNTVDIEGLKVTANSTFNNTKDGVALTANDLEDLDDIRTGLEITDEITFSQEKDLDPVIDLIKELVSDYNELMSKVKTYFTEVPLNSSGGGSYKPLTDDDASSMTESAVASYEEKAKTGLLFGDTNMRNLYNSMSSIFSASGAYGIDLANMGFSVGFGQTSSGDFLDLDETKLREMLETDFDTVKNAFTATAASTGSDGLMASMKSTIDTYASVSGVDKGILVNAAGSEHSSLSLLSNSMQDKIDAWTTLISTWEEKLSNKVDYYTAQFTKLEILMSEMNSQSSALADLGTG